ncbi:hypothetical protein niasHT_003201 [Heterodera trifolii]|uniref:Uncharacterized protein n=1 Tax=Heterodera trifolii TaxID=157864 RepID=A0ABD2LNK2_9BILA
MPKHQMANAPGEEKAPFRLHTPFFTLSQHIKYSSSSSYFAHWATSAVVRQCFSAEGEGVPFIGGAVAVRTYIGIFSPFGGRQNAAPGGGGNSGNFWVCGRPTLPQVGQASAAAGATQIRINKIMQKCWDV